MTLINPCDKRNCADSMDALTGREGTRKLRRVEPTDQANATNRVGSDRLKIAPILGSQRFSDANVLAMQAPRSDVAEGFWSQDLISPPNRPSAMASMGESEDGIKPHPISTQELFNLMQTDVRVWDLRSGSNFVKNHFFLAQHWPNTDDPAQLSQALDQVEEDWPCDHRCGNVLIFDDQSKHHLEMAASVLKGMGEYNHWYDTRCLSIDFEEVARELDFLCTQNRYLNPQLCFPAQITSHLYLGSELSAKQYPVLLNLGITHVLNITNECPNFFESGSSIQYLKIGLNDTTDEDLLRHLPKALSALNQALSQGGKVLVHCSRGLSRSAAVVTAWIMLHQNCGFDTALAQVKAKRFGASPNPGFVHQLKLWEAQIT